MQIPRERYATQFHLLNNGFEIRNGVFISLSVIHSISPHTRSLSLCHFVELLIHFGFFIIIFLLLVLFHSIGYISAVANAIFRFFGLILVFLFASPALLHGSFIGMPLFDFRLHAGAFNSFEIEYVRSLVSWNFLLLSQTNGNVESVGMYSGVYMQ